MPVDAPMPASPEMDDTPPQGVDLSGAQARPDIPKYGNEDEEFLFGKTDRPSEPVRPAGVTAKHAPAPDIIYRNLPALLEAASDPDAPAELHAFIRLLQHQLGA